MRTGRRPIASLNYLLTSHVWRQDHNGFTHQEPGFIDHALNKKADVVMACAGDIPTLETLAAVGLLRQHFPDIKIRVVNVVDLMTLYSPIRRRPSGDTRLEMALLNARPR